MVGAVLRKGKGRTGKTNQQIIMWGCQFHPTEINPRIKRKRGLRKVSPAGLKGGGRAREIKPERKNGGVKR